MHIIKSNFTVVIVTYNRAVSLNRLLRSLADAYYKEHTNLTLIISIDGGGSNDVKTVANEYLWDYGEKIIIQHKNNLGLRAHIIECGELSNTYGAVLILEDDLYLSQYYYGFTTNMIEYYIDEDQVAGFSLYSYSYNEYAKMPFTPIYSSFDVFFMQIASSWGQIWTNGQWKGFKKWYDKNKNEGVVSTDLLPIAVVNWPETSWKKYFHKYLVEENMFFVFPYESYVTNFTEVGVNFSMPMSQFQVQLVQNEKKLIMCLIDGVDVKYDAFYELMPNAWENNLPLKYSGSTELDLYGTKLNRPIISKYLISINTYKLPFMQFSDSLIPTVYNIIDRLEGTTLSLGLTEKFSRLSPVKRIMYRVSKIFTPSADDLLLYSIGYIRLRIKLKINKIRKYFSNRVI